MTDQDLNKAALRNLLEAVDAGDLDRVLSFYSTDYLDHDASESRAGGESHYHGLRVAFERFYNAFKDVRHELADVVAEGDRVAARIEVTARHTGNLFGMAPTGRLVRNDSIVIYRFEAGRIRERWCRERRSTRAAMSEAAEAAKSDEIDKAARTDG